MGSHIVTLKTILSLYETELLTSNPLQKRGSSFADYWTWISFNLTSSSSVNCGLVYPQVYGWVDHEVTGHDHFKTISPSWEALSSYQSCSIFVIDAFSLIFVYYPEKKKPSLKDETSEPAAVPFPPPLNSPLLLFLTKLKNLRIITPKVVYSKESNEAEGLLESFLIEDKIRFLLKQFFKELQEQ